LSDIPAEEESEREGRRGEGRRGKGRRGEERRAQGKGGEEIKRGQRVCFLHYG